MAGKSLASQCATPDPCRPTALIIPCAIGCTRGAGLPAHASALNDFTTTAPSVERSPYADNSAPWPAVPDAAMIGCANSSSPTLTLVVTKLRSAAMVFLQTLDLEGMVELFGHTLHRRQCCFNSGHRTHMIDIGCFANCFAVGTTTTTLRGVDNE